MGYVRGIRGIIMVKLVWDMNILNLFVCWHLKGVCLSVDTSKELCS